MFEDPTNSTASMDDKIAYHEEMERIAIRAGDFTQADHHRNMLEILKKIKEQQRNNSD